MKDISFEAPNSPSVFKQAFKPKVNLDLNTTSQKVADDQYEVVVKVTAQVNDSETGTTSFLAEVEQAGLFRISGIEGAQLEQTLGAFCPKAMYAQRKQREAQQASQAAENTH